MATRLSPRNSEVNALEQRGYLIGKKIGQGSYATVHLAEYVDGPSTKKMRLACKIFDKEKAPRDFLDKFFPRELEILTKIENPHIIQVHSILQRGPRVFIFMRYADNGDLLDFVKRNGVVPEQQSKLWFRQMASGLHYLHGKNIAHRDLKCENILLSRKFNVKLADFGFARYCIDHDGRRVLSHTYCGSAAYAAPEVVSGTPYNPKLADVWSLGIILFIMLNASMPFDDSNLRKLLKNQMSRNWVFRSRVKDTVSTLAKSIVKHILEPDITLRFTLDRVLNHEWIRTKKDKSGSLVGRLVHSAPPIHPQTNGGGGLNGGGTTATGSPPTIPRIGLSGFKGIENASQPSTMKSIDNPGKESSNQSPITVE
ncbi:testis-specific serine/threonine-protein kinase 2 [Cephus cinctus]|uniref:Testis-specific serine/threonine-protein kinase 2 n=1 Tax=Cephus cinctus TaxID=211228 RepID=A0AAJ7VZV4_CEPCN|nr:testis-specific serine/threonine-protein kinase 2 [Cephus cinctus]XP_024938855.1 testis-specific serine/threonine-protein kinase 2 [Cephus cinctus]XP_024938856.1 testis-specific serine/threonine-protein kinase 2 [Cephus cinctus]XP_024938857.1 testis-specific serine/threonine-protein kinase 2 [Cephus cinctus]